MESMENEIETKFCTICMDVLIDPVTLVCNHTFCKECVENLLKFHYDGRATIICPMKCEEETLLSCDVTASCLVTNLESYINVDLSLTCTDGKAVCHWKVCERKICRFCLTCNLTFCRKCWNEHLLQCSNSVPHIPVKYNYKTKDISILCVDHQTSANFLCLNCDYQFICVYCKHRLHKGHFVEHAYKSSICLKHSNLKGLFDDDKQRTGMQMSKLPLDEIGKCEERLKTELKKRKLKCLMDYMKLLNKEESKLQLEFQRQSSLFKAIKDEHSKELLPNGKTPRKPIIEVNLSSLANSSSTTNLGNLNIKVNETFYYNEEVHAPIYLHFQETEINMENYDFRRDFEDCLSFRTELCSKEVDSKLNPDAVPVFFPSKDVSPTIETHSNLNPEAAPVFYPHNNNGAQSNGVSMASPDEIVSPLAAFLAHPVRAIHWSPAP